LLDPLVERVLDGFTDNPCSFIVGPYRRRAGQKVFAAVESSNVAPTGLSIALELGRAGCFEKIHQYHEDKIGNARGFLGGLLKIGWDEKCDICHILKIRQNYTLLKFKPIRQKQQFCKIHPFPAILGERPDPLNFRVFRENEYNFSRRQFFVSV
jgi:hypothetical protein